MSRALFLHCALATSRAWRGVLAALPEVEPILVDLPGHGRSPDPAPGAEYQGRALEDAVAALGGRPAQIVGHSFGATVALRMALEAPELVAGLTLIEPVFFAAARTHDAAAYAQHRADFAPILTAWEAGDHAATARAFLALWGDGTPWEALPEGQQRYSAALIHHVIAQFAAIEEDCADQLAPGRLEAIEAPVLFLRGGETRPIIAAIHGGLMARMRGAQEHVIPGAGHMLPITHPEETAGFMRL